MSWDATELILVEHALRDFVARNADRRYLFDDATSSVELRLGLAQLAELGYLSPCEPDLAAALVGGLAELSGSLAAIVLSSQVAHRHLGGYPCPTGSRLATTLFAPPLSGKPELHVVGGKLQGIARLVVGGAFATHLVLLARAEDDSARMVLLEARDSEVVNTAPHLGLRGAACVDISLERKAGDGVEILGSPSASADAETATVGGISSLLVGLLTRHSLEVQEYASQRVQGNKPISLHPQVAALIEVITRARALALACKNAAENRADLLPLAAREARAAADAGLQCFGGLGYITNCPIATLYRDIYAVSLFRP